MTSRTMYSKRKNIHLIHASEKEDSSLFADESTILEKMNLVYKSGERNTEHGITTVTVLDFYDNDQRKKAFNFLVNHYSPVVWKLLPRLKYLGCHYRADVRYRTAQAVGELMCEMDFIHIKDEIILPWAKSFDLGININVGVSFSVAAKHEKYADNIKKLLKHWSTTSDSDLNRTALVTIISLCDIWPEEAIEMVRQSLGKDKASEWDYAMLVTLSALVLRELCNHDKTETVIEKLKEWSSNEDSDLRGAGAALAFLQAIDFSHAFEHESIRDKVIQLYQVCLDGMRLDKLDLIRISAIDKLKNWAEESFGDEDKEEFIKQLFMRLYLRAKTDRDRERLDFYLKRWQQQDKEKRFGFIIKNLIR